MAHLDLSERLTTRVDGSSLAVVRIVFGAIGVLSAARLLLNGWVESLLVAPDHHLAYPAMSWVPVPPAWALYAQVVVIGVSALMVVLGVRYRVAIVVFWVAFTWLEFLEASIYLNHYWFVTVMGALLVVLPADASFSLDARRRGGPRPVPMGAVWLVRAQVGVVYVFAGLAKLNGDWLLHGLPLALWLPARSDHPVFGAIVDVPNAALVLSIAGAFFDCTVVGFLLWRRTRLVAWIVVVSFHVITWMLFPIIGVFPWLMIGASTVFFDPDWPRKLAARLGRHTPEPVPETSDRRRLVGTRVLVALGVVWLAVQVALPMRHLLYPGDHRWSGEAFRFGWNVLLVEKAGDVSFRVTDTTTGERWTESGTDQFTPQQWRVMSSEPELIRQAAHVVADDARSDHPGDEIEVRVDAFASLNGRAAERLIDPDVDLAAEPWRLGPQRWILPVPTSDPPPG